MDDELGALRESASSPSSGEVCLEVCSRLCFSLPSSVFYHSYKKAQKTFVTCVPFCGADYLWVVAQWQSIAL